MNTKLGILAVLVALVLGANSAAAPAATRGGGAISVVDTLETAMQTTFKDRFGCIVAPIGGRIQVLVTARASVRRANEIVRRQGLQRDVRVRVIDAAYSRLALGRLGTSIITALGQLNPDAFVTTDPSRVGSARRCLDITLNISTSAPAWVSDYVTANQPNWRDRVTVRSFAPGQRPASDPPLPLIVGPNAST